MIDEYNLNDLIKIFSKHAEIYTKTCKNIPNENFHNEYDYFNLSQALLEICKEIKSIKEKFEAQND